MTLTPAQAISAYIHAKDGNRPHLMPIAFTDDVALQMLVQTDAIDFPPALEGVGPVSDALVRRFHQAFENVYTFCLCAEPAEPRARAFSSDWMVAMSEKVGGVVRLGYGRYDWSFEAGTGRVRSLRITIARMERYPSQAQAEVMRWASSLPYPWCEPGIARQHAPACAREALPMLA